MSRERTFFYLDKLKQEIDSQPENISKEEFVRRNDMFLEYLFEATKVYRHNLSNLFENYGQMVRSNLEENVRIRGEIQQEKRKLTDQKVLPSQLNRKRTQKAAMMKESALQEKH